MPYRIVLEGEQARIEEFYVSRLLDIDDTLSLLTTERPLATPRLPDNTVLLASPGDGLFRFVIEQPPRRVHMRLPVPFDEYYREDDEHLWGAPPGKDGYAVIQVPVPWEYYFFAISAEPPKSSSDIIDGVWCSRASLLWARERVTSWDSRVSVAHLNNIFDSGDICLGEMDVAASDPISYMNDIVNNFYESAFNWDTGYKPGPAETYADWVEGEWDDPLNWDDLGQSSLSAVAGHGLDHIRYLDRLQKRTLSAVTNTEITDWVKANIPAFIRPGLVRYLTES